MGLVRVLLLGDTHLGFDLPRRPRVEKPRRGEDFFRCYERALAPAFAGAIDLVVHGGDVFHHSRVAPSVVDRAFEPLRRLADRGVDVAVVAGNHERSRMPCPLLACHRRIHHFDRPRCVVLRRAGLTLALAGIPFVRGGIRDRFRDLVRQTGALDVAADLRLLCLHECVEGATVGPSDYVFRGGRQVVRGADIPSGFAAVLAGHIHRHQVLTTELAGAPLSAPVLYPGSVERTAFAEERETKGYMTLELLGGRAAGGTLARWRFHPLPARPMVSCALELGGVDEGAIPAQVRGAVNRAPRGAVLRLVIRGRLSSSARRVLWQCVTAARRRIHLRADVPWQGRTPS